MRKEEVLALFLALLAVFAVGFGLGFEFGINRAITESDIYLRWHDDSGKVSIGTPTEAEFMIVLDGEVYIHNALEEE